MESQIWTAKNKKSYQDNLDSKDWSSGKIGQTAELWMGLPSLESRLVESYTQQFATYDKI